MSGADDFLDAAVDAARAAGQVLLDLAGQVTVREKAPTDLVTSADLAAQETIRQRLHRAFPQDDFLAEEAAPPASRGARRWIVDPLDGTTNYVHQIPFYAVSIGLEIDGRMQVGVVYSPALDECFTAVRGRGARLNGRPIRVSAIRELRQAVVATGFPTDRALARENLDYFGAFVWASQSVRRLGAAALNLAYVACGRFDGNWATSLHPWDAAAGVLLVQEAGGTVTRLDGAAYELDQPTLLASNGPLHAAMLDVIRRAR